MIKIFRRPRWLLLSLSYIVVASVFAFTGNGFWLFWAILSLPWIIYAGPSLKEYRYWKKQRKIWEASNRNNKDGAREMNHIKRGILKVIAFPFVFAIGLWVMFCLWQNNYHGTTDRIEIEDRERNKPRS